MKDKIKKVLFLELFENCFKKNFFPKNKEPNIELLRTITLLKKNNFEIEFLDFKIDKITKNNLIEKIKENHFIFIDVKTYNRFFSLEIVNLIKKNNKNAEVFFYGQHPEEEPFFFLKKEPNLFIIQKEIYPFFENFLKIKDEKEIFHLNNIIYYSKNKIIKNSIKEIKNLDKLEYIDLENLSKGYYTLYPMKSKKFHKWGYITLSKGCPFNCIFCSKTLRTSYGKKMYYFSIEEAYKRIKRLVDKGFNFIRFFDDDLHDKKFIQSLCKKILQENLKFKWMIQLRADSIDEKTIKLMKKSGCECVNVGVETGSNKINKILKKDESIDKVKENLGLFRKHRILRVGFFMIGNPQETNKDLKLTFKLIKELKLNMIQIAYFTPYPGSPYYKALPLKVKNKIEFYHYSDVVYNYSKVSKIRLHKTMKSWIRWFYLNPKNFFNLLYYRMFCLINNPKKELKIYYGIFKILFSSK